MTRAIRSPLARLASSIQAIQERHQERHRPSGFRFAFAASVDFLQPQHWDLVAEQGGFFLQRDVLRAIETHGAENVTHRNLRLLHTTVADAIAWRCQRLSLGRTALEPKAALGAKPEPMSVWLRHRVPTLNWIMRGLLGAVPHCEAHERSPFKAASRDKPLGTAIIQGGRTCTACEMKKHFNHMSLCLGLAVYRVRQY